jgi:hypothetical protein
MTENYKFAHADPWWTDEFKHLEYKRYPSNNPVEDNEWREAGFGKLEFVSASFTMADLEANMPEFANPFLNLVDWDHISLKFYMMMPFEGLPPHRDSYVGYKKHYGIEELSRIRRCVVFLENWKSGHYFDVENVGFVNWRAGDYVLLNHRALHYAVNIGSEPRYTLQITGVAKQ